MSDPQPTATDPARPRAARRETKTERPTATAGGSGSATLDLDHTLAEGLRKLTAATGASRALAWCRDSSGAPIAVAPAQRGVERAPLGDDEAGILRELFGSKRAKAFDIGLLTMPEPMQALGRRLGIAAGAIVRSSTDEPVAVLWLGGSELTAGRVRPRVLATLDEMVDRLRGPVTGIAALHRLGRLDREVRRLDRLAVLGSLVAEIVHEIRNPLVSIKTFLQLVPERADDPEFRGEFRDMVAGEVERMERLLETVVRQARPAEPDDEEGTEIADLVESVCDLLRYRALDREVSLRTNLPAGLARVAIHQDSLRQVVLNLTLNAIDATRAGGEVTLTAAPAAGQVEFVVDDQGPGVAADQRDQIFEPFYSTRPDHVGGLGLAITRRLVEESGGTIWADDAPGGGARFRVRLMQL